MSQPEIKISDNDIAHAEMILFGKVGVFNGERKVFIKNLETTDLQAVPGSGKTTALLAKLLILEKHLPFKDGSGILVISHTNAAVDKIRDTIKKYCPKLFVYPNFLGTIQSFVDQFLAIPYYTQRFNKKPHRIDDDIYEENVYSPHKAQAWLNNNPHQKDMVLYKSRLNENEELIFGFNYSGSFPLKTKTNDTYKSLLEMKQVIREKGFLCFDDAYIFAIKAIKTYPVLNLLLQKRFRYVFVDEMQDMDKHQYDLLESIFYDGSSNSSIYQRIGDKNQAIFSSEVKLKKIWQDRSSVLHISGSRRLSPSIAKVVEPFGIPRLPINGENITNNDGTENNIPSHIIVFDDNSVEKVIPKYCGLIKDFKAKGRIPKDHKYPIKAIAWRKGNDGKLGLKNYWKDYEPEATKSKVDYENLKSHLIFANKGDSKNEALKDIYKSIMNAFLKVLHLEEITNPDNNNRPYTIHSLNKHLKEENLKLYERFRLRVIGWCRNIFAGQIEDAHKEIKKVTPKFLKYVFGKTLNKAAEFVNDEPISESTDTKTVSNKTKKKDNIYRCEKTGLKVEVGTVHSVKGTTHTATLYLESYYYQDGRGENAKSYESQRLKEQFEGKDISPHARDRTKQSARMVYVGFSRPTHLLCFAIHKDRCDEAVFESSGWEICTVF